MLSRVFIFYFFLHSDKKRGRGNDLYSRGDYAGAIDVYKRALKYLEGRTDKVGLSN